MATDRERCPRCPDALDLEYIGDDGRDVNIYQCTRCNVSGPLELFDELAAERAALDLLRAEVTRLRGASARSAGEAGRELVWVNVYIRCAADELLEKAHSAERSRDDRDEHGVAWWRGRAKAFREAKHLVNHIMGHRMPEPAQLLEQLDQHTGEAFAARRAAELRADWTRYSELTVVCREMLEHRKRLAPDDELSAARLTLLSEESGQ